MWRYLFVLVDEALRLIPRPVGALRPTGPGTSRPAGPLPGGRVSPAGWQATCCIRAFERSERIYSAMLARGYDGEIRQLPPRSASATWLPGDRDSRLLPVPRVGSGRSERTEPMHHSIEIERLILFLSRRPRCLERISRSASRRAIRSPSWDQMVRASPHCCCTSMESWRAAASITVSGMQVEPANWARTCRCGNGLPEPGRSVVLPHGV